MKGFYEWLNKLGYTIQDLKEDNNLKEVLIDEYTSLELFHLEQVEESRGKHK